MRLIEKYNILHEEVATNVRSVLPHLSVAAGGTTMNVFNPSCQASGSSAEAANPSHFHKNHCASRLELCTH